VLQLLEENVVKFLHHSKLFWEKFIKNSAVMVQGYTEINEDSNQTEANLTFEVLFEFYSLTDELVYYGLRGFSLRSVYKLANLLYSVILKNKSYIKDLKKLDSAVELYCKRWISRLTYFLSFSPIGVEELQQLSKLEQELTKQ